MVVGVVLIVKFVLIEVVVVVEVVDDGDVLMSGPTGHDLGGCG